MTEDAPDTTATQGKIEYNFTRLRQAETYCRELGEGLRDLVGHLDAPIETLKEEIGRGRGRRDEDPEAALAARERKRFGERQGDFQVGQRFEEFTAEARHWLRGALQHARQSERAVHESVAQMQAAQAGAVRGIEGSLNDGLDHDYGAREEDFALPRSAAQNDYLHPDKAMIPDRQTQGFKSSNQFVDRVASLVRVLKERAPIFTACREIPALNSAGLSCEPVGSREDEQLQRLRGIHFAGLEDSERQFRNVGDALASGLGSVGGPLDLADLSAMLIQIPRYSWSGLAPEAAYNRFARFDSGLHEYARAAHEFADNTGMFVDRTMQGCEKLGDLEHASRQAGGFAEFEREFDRTDEVLADVEGMRALVTQPIFQIHQGIIQQPRSSFEKAVHNRVLDQIAVANGRSAESLSQPEKSEEFGPIAYPKIQLTWEELALPGSPAPHKSGFFAASSADRIRELQEFCARYAAITRKLQDALDSADDNVTRACARFSSELVKLRAELPSW